MVNTLCRAVDVGRIWRVAVEEVTQISSLWSLLLGFNVIIKSGVLWSNFNPSSSSSLLSLFLLGNFTFQFDISIISILIIIEINFYYTQV